MEEAYPAVRREPRTACITAPPKSRWRSVVPDAMPTPVTGTELVSDLEAGVRTSPAPMPMSR